MLRKTRFSRILALVLIICMMLVSMPQMGLSVNAAAGTKVLDFNGTDFGTDVNYTGTHIQSVSPAATLVTDTTSVPEGFTDSVYVGNNTAYVPTAVEFQNPIDLSKVTSVKLRMYVSQDTPASNMSLRIFNAGETAFETATTPTIGAWSDIELLDILKGTTITKNADGYLERFVIGYRSRVAGNVYFDSVTIAYSDESYSVEKVISDMSVSSVLNFTANTGADWCFNLNMNGTWPTTGSFDKYTSTDIAVEIKNAAGETLATASGETLTHYKNESYWRLAIWGNYAANNVPAKGDKLTISSGQLTCSTDTNKIVNVTEATVLEYDGTNWSIYVEKTVEDMSVSGVANFTANTGADWCFNLNMNGTWPTTGSFDEYTSTDVVIEIENAAGETLATVTGGALTHYKNESYWRLAIWGNYTGSNAPAQGDKLTISSGQLTYSADVNKIVNVTEATVLEYDGTSWSIYVEKTIEDMSVSGVANFSANTNADWCFNLNMNGTWPTTGSFDNYTSTDVTVEIQNAAGETLATVSGGALTHYKNESYWRLAIWGNYTGSNAPAQGDKLTISSGQLTYSADVNKIVNVTEATVLEYDGTSWSIYVEKTIEDMSVLGVANFSANTNADWCFNLNMNGTWPTTGNFDEYASTDVAVEIKNGAGETLATVSGGALTHHKNETYWRLAIWGNYTGNNVPAKGDTLIISSGQLVYSADVTKIVNVTGATVLEYSGSNWVVVLGDSGIDADVNSDIAVNSSDLVRLLRHQNNESIPINIEREDINYDGSKDVTDVSSLRKVLLGMIYYRKSDTNPSIPFGTPQYHSDEQMNKMAYSCPPVGTWSDDGTLFEPYDEATIDAAFQTYKAAGFNLLNSEHVAVFQDYAENAEQNEPFRVFMQAAERNGLGVIVACTYLNGVLDYDGSGNYASWKTVLPSIISIIQKYPAFRGFMLGDEMTIDKIGIYTELMSFFNENYPELIISTAQYPNYVHNSNPEKLTTDTSTHNTMELAYRNYVEKFGSAAGHFKYDNYALTYHTNKNIDYLSRGYEVQEDWWYPNLKWVAEESLEHGFTTGVAIQTSEMPLYDGYDSTTINYSPDKQEDIGFQLYTSMAYGIREFDYFTYYTHFVAGINSNAMISDDGATTGVYTAVQGANKEIAKFENVYLTFKYCGTAEIEESGSAVAVDERLTTVDSSGVRTLIGHMKDTDGFDGYMIANASGPRTGSDATVTLTFANATHAIVYVNGEPEIVELINSQTTVDVALGKGAFVIPLRIED